MRKVVKEREGKDRRVQLRQARYIAEELGDGSRDIRLPDRPNDKRDVIQQNSREGSH